MSFDDMPDRGRLILPGAMETTGRMLELSKRIVPGQRCRLDVPYGDDFYQKIDIFLPREEGLTGLPVFMFFHGGAWRHGFKEWMGFMAPNPTDLPAIFVSGNYRLSPEAKWPAQVEDVADGVAWVYDNIGRYGGDRDRIFLGGHSAGGHLTSLVTLVPEYLATRGLPDDAVTACLPMSGVFDVRLAGAEPGGTRETVALILLENSGDDVAASPVCHAAGNRAPFFVCWGEHDTDDIKTDAAAMTAALEREAGHLETCILPGVDHFEANEACKDRDCPYIEKVRAWMRDPPARAR